MKVVSIYTPERPSSKSAKAMVSMTDTILTVHNSK